MYLKEEIMNSKKAVRLLLFTVITLYTTNLLAEILPYDRVVLWGHKLYTHTHGYIHAALEKAFKHLGYHVLWLDNNDSIENIEFSNSLFITEGQVDHNMPLRHDCHYILHNCNLTRYKELYDAGRCLILQVYVHAILSHDVVRLDDYIYFEPSTKTLYMPWATDLLPHEIDEIKSTIKNVKKENTIYWVGSIWDGYYGNQHEINAFKVACSNAHIDFQHISHVNSQENIHIVQKSLIAPALQGKWQCDKGYIPCRIFKNISYGVFGITNSKTVYELFQGKIVYNPNCYQLLFDALEQVSSMDDERRFELMDFVKEKHTYLNRIEMLSFALNLI